MRVNFSRLSELLKMIEVIDTQLYYFSHVFCFLLMRLLCVLSQVTTIRVSGGWMREEEQGTSVIIQVVKKVLLMDQQLTREGSLCLISCLQRSAFCS